jgi:hypothetical protein
VKIGSLPAAGQLRHNGTAVSAGQLVPASDILAGLLRFVPAANGNGGSYATFAFQVQDSGGTANGGLDLDQSANTITINVTPVNDAPTGTDGVVTTDEDTTITFSIGDFGFSDSADIPENNFTLVKVHALPSDGTLSNNGAVVVVGQLIPVSDIANGVLQFDPSANDNGLPYTTFAFQVKDTGGTSDGGVDIDPTPNTITIHVLPVNDAPSFTLAAAQTTGNYEVTQSVSDWATIDSAGPPDESGQSFIEFQVTTDHPEYFRDQPQIDVATGTLTYRALPNIRDVSAIVTVRLKDDGGTANGGIDTSEATFSINIEKPHPWHNVSLPFDVTGDGLVTAADAERVIDYVNAFGAGNIPNENQPNLTSTFYVDTIAPFNYVYAGDALDVINFVNAFLGGIVYEDRNDNGRRDLTEIGIEGVEIHVEGHDNLNNPIPSQFEIVESDVYGQFKISQHVSAGYVPGGYSIRFNGGVASFRLLPDELPTGYIDGKDYPCEADEECTDGDVTKLEDEDEEYWYFEITTDGASDGGLEVNYGLRKP